MKNPNSFEGISNIKKQLQESYTKNYNIHFISENSSDIDTLSAEETRFNTLIQRSLNKLYLTLHSNKENKTYWGEFVTGAAGFALFFGTNDQKLKAFGAAIVAGSVGSAAIREHAHEKLQRSALSFLKVINKKEEMDRWTFSLISNLDYRFQNLIKQLRNDESGVDKLANFFIIQIIFTTLNNQAEFGSSKEILDYVIREILPDKNSKAYDSFLNFLKLDVFKAKIATKKNQALTIEACLCHASAVTESGSICIREGIENPFLYPIQRITSEEEAKRQGFIILLNIPTSWDIFIESEENSAENVKTFKKIQPEKLLFVPTLLLEIFKRQCLARSKFVWLQQLPSANESAINETLDIVTGYLDFLLKIKTNTHQKYSDCGLEKFSANLSHGETETIQLIFFLLDASRLAKECEQRCFGLCVYKNEQQKPSSKIISKVEQVTIYRQRFDHALQHFYKAHKEYVNEYVNGQELFSNLRSKTTKNSSEIDIPSGESLKARDMTCIPPSQTKYFLNVLNPFHLNKNADLLIEKWGYTQYKTAIKFGACIVTILIGVTGYYFAGVIWAGGAFIVPVGTNFIGEFLEYKKKCKEYRLNREERADIEAQEDIKVIKFINELEDANLEEIVVDGDNNNEIQQLLPTESSKQVAKVKSTWKNDFEEARKFYAQGKTAFYQKDLNNAITFFQQAKNKYKDVLQEKEADVKIKEEAEKRLTKLKNPEGKYSPAKLTR